MYFSRVICAALATSAICMAGLAILALPEDATAQTVPESQTAGHAHVIARDKDGKLVTDLTVDQLQVVVNGVARHIDSLTPGYSGPIYLGYLVDVSGSRRGELPNIETTGSTAFFRRVLEHGGKAFVGVFNEDVSSSEFFEDLPILFRAMQQAASIPPRGSTALYDTITWACQRKLISMPGRRILLVVTDGADNASKVNLREVTQAVQLARAEVHVLIPLGDPPNQRARKHAESEMKKLTESTGGSVHQFQNRKEFEKELQTVGDELMQGYVLAYSPAEPQNPKKLPNLKLECVRKDVRLQVRQYPSPGGN